MIDTHYYAGLWLLKMLDLAPEDGGRELPVVLPGELSPLEPVLERLAVEGLIEIDRKRGRYRLTDAGLQHIALAIDEAESFIDEFDDQDAQTIVAELRRRNLDPLRVRFLWGWYQGELDDLVLFQQRRGAQVEPDWASYLTGDALYQELARDLAPSHARGNS